MKRHLPVYLASAVLAAGLAACSQQSPAPAASAAPGSTPAPSSAPVIPARAPAATPAPVSASTAPLPPDQAVTKHYKIAINLPTLPAGEKPLEAALRTTVDNAKREFLQALPNPTEMPEFANRQFELLLDFKIAAQNTAFTSVRETGMQDTGGAHPLPVQAAFVFDRKADKLLALDDLFVQPDAARRVLANYAHDTLLKKLMANAPTPSEGSPEAIREWKANTIQMLDDGTKPTHVNYSVFIVRTGASPSAPSPGLTLIFPPYQVAPYVAGTQTVDVPASLFAKFLKPAYSGDFTTH